MAEETMLIVKNKTWELVELLECKNIISLKWIFETKLNADGSINKNKERLVVRDFCPKLGVDYQETFASIARFKTVSNTCNCSSKQWDVYQFDVKSGILNGDLVKEIYVEQPIGFIKVESEQWVYKLNKALYSLKVSTKGLVCKG